MKTLDSARGRCRQFAPRRDESWTPVYEPGPILRALGAALSIVFWLRPWHWLELWL
jgi:hypothetical protein